MYNTLHKLAPSASMEVTALAHKMKREGREVISLSIGDTHFDPPAIIKQRLEDAVRLSHTHYVDAQGIFELREKISSLYRGYSTQDIMITPGVKQGLFYSFCALPFKKICILEPAWLGYHALATMTDKQYVSHSIKERNWIESLADLDFDALIFCSPNNPDGTTFDKQQLEKLAGIVKNKNAYLMVDKIYEQFTFTESKIDYHSLIDYEKLVIFDGFSKSHAMTGLRIGYLLSKNADFISNSIKLQQNIATCASSIAQYAAIGFIDALPDVQQYKDYYERNRNLVSDIIPALEKFKPDGGFYYFIDLSLFGINDGNEFCKYLLNKTGVALVPGNAYGSSFGQWARLSYSIETEKLTQALELIKPYLTTGH